MPISPNILFEDCMVDEDDDIVEKLELDIIVELVFLPELPKLLLLIFISLIIFFIMSLMSKGIGGAPPIPSKVMPLIGGMSIPMDKDPKGPLLTIWLELELLEE